MIPILRAPPRATVRVFLRDHEVALVERRAALWQETALALLPTGVNADELAASLRLQALARVVDLPASVLFGEVVEVRVVPDHMPLPGRELLPASAPPIDAYARGRAHTQPKPLSGSGRFERVEASLIVIA